MPPIGAAPDEADPAEHNTASAQPSASQRAAAKSSGRRRSRRDTSPAVEPLPDGNAQALLEPASQRGETVKAEADEDDALAPVDGSTFEKLKRRRLMRGAATSHQDFQRYFGNLSENNTMFQGAATELVDTSDTMRRQRQRRNLPVDTYISIYTVRIEIQIYVYCI